MFVQDVLKQMNTQLARIEVCLNRLSEEQIWERVNGEMLSIGNLCIHLAGNEYQHFVSGIGNKPFIRERSNEFSMNGGMNVSAILTRMKDVRQQSESVLGELLDQDLQREVQIWYDPEDWKRMRVGNTESSDSYYVRPIQSHLFYVAEHYGYHTGQIVYLTKLLAEGKGPITDTRH